MGKRKSKRKEKEPDSPVLGEQPSEPTGLTLTLPPRFRPRPTAEEETTPPPPASKAVARQVRKGVEGLLGQHRTLRSNSKKDNNQFTEQRNKINNRALSGQKRKAHEASSDSDRSHPSNAEVDELASDSDGDGGRLMNDGLHHSSPDPSSEGGLGQPTEETSSDEEPSEPEVDELLSSSRSDSDEPVPVTKSKPAVKNHRSKTSTATPQVQDVQPDPVTELRFSIPHDGASTKVWFSITISWNELQLHLADKWSIPPKDVRVAYRLSTSPRNSGFDHLPDEKTLRRLVQEAIRAIQTLEKSRRQDNDRSSFLVELKDMREASKKQKNKLSSSKKPSKKKKRVKSTSDSSGSASSSSDENDSVTVEKVRAKKRSSAQWIEQLEKDNFCQEHNAACYKAVGQEHHQYRRDELGLWSLLLTKGYSSTTNPPPALKIADARTRGNESKTKTPARPEAPQPSVAYPYSFPPLPPPAYPYYPYPQHGIAAPPWGSPIVPTASGSYLPNPMSSSPPEAKTEDVAIFPLLVDWLKELDAGPRGVDNRNFAQYTQKLVDDEFLRVSDIADLSANEMIAMYPDMPIGTARKLVDYACKDTAAIRKKQQKSSRRR